MALSRLYVRPQPLHGRIGRLVHRIFTTRELYAFHAPQVECIGKGKSRQPYEFGVKVGIASRPRMRQNHQPRLALNAAV